MLGKKSMAKSPKKKDKMPELISLQEACDILKCHPNTLRQWDKKGVLPAIRIGVKRVMRYRKEAILKLLNQKK
jgi:excisionase family DNA binding protein